MPGKILDGFQSLHFDTLTLNQTRVNWVKRWSETCVISLIGPTTWVSFARDGKTQLKAHTMVFKEA
jgi:hypothetical protein